MPTTPSNLRVPSVLTGTLQSVQDSTPTNSALKIATDMVEVNSDLQVNDGTGNPGSKRVWTTQKVFNVLDFGAGPNKSSSVNSAAFQAAINAAATYIQNGQWGGTVLIPAGIYKLDTGLTVPRYHNASLQILGEGRLSSKIIIKNVTAQTIIKVNSVVIIPGNTRTGTFQSGSKVISGVSDVTDIKAGDHCIVSQNDAGDVDKWSTIREVLSDSDEINLFYNYEGATGRDFFETKWTANHGIIIKGMGFEIEGPYPSGNDRHTAIDLGDEGAAFLDDIFIWGSYDPNQQIDSLFEYGIIARRHGNEFHKISLANCVAGFYLVTDSGDQEVNQQRLDNCEADNCRQYGIRVRGYNAIITNCLFHNYNWDVISQDDLTAAIFIEKPKDGHRKGDCRAGLIQGCYFEGWGTHIKMNARGNCIISNFHSGTGIPQANGQNYYSFNTGTTYDPEIEPTTLRIGNSFQPIEEGETHLNYGQFYNNTNSNLTGDIKLSGNVKIDSNAPELVLRDAEVGQDLKQWKIYTQGGELLGTAIKDDDTNATEWLRVTRSLHFINSVRLSTNGFERLRINSFGNVGIGTDSPQVKLHVSGLIRLEPQPSTPSGAKGDLCATTDGKLWFHNGSSWKRVDLI